MAGPLSIGNLAGRQATQVSQPCPVIQGDRRTISMMNHCLLIMGVALEKIAFQLQRTATISTHVVVFKPDRVVSVVFRLAPETTRLR